MPAPYSLDLRARIVAAYLSGQDRISDLVKRFNISRDTVRRYIQRHSKTGSVAPDPHGGGRPAIIGIEEVNKLVAVIAKQPDATIVQMCATYEEMYKVSVSESAMQRALERFGVTSKKRSLIALEQTRPDVVARRKEFDDLQKLVPAKKLVFLDETGVNRSMTKREAWALIGLRAVDFVLGNKGKNVTLIGAVRLSGPISMQTLEYSLAKESFSKYIRTVLAPKLEAGDVVVLDTCACHNDREALDAIQAAGAFVKFLPPYSPDLNPIEMVWNALKRRFERIDVTNTEKIRAALRKSWRNLRSLPMFDLFASCGYLATQPL